MTRRVVLCSIIFILLMGMRLVYLSADPPHNLGTSSAGYFVDEGGWLYNARNRVLFGSWELDDSYNKMYMEPFVNLYYFVSFRLLGVGLIQGRLVSVFFTFIVFAGLFEFLAKRYGFGWAGLLLIVLGINYVFLIFNRIAHPRMGMLAFLVVSMVAFGRGIKKPIFMVLSSLMAILALSCGKSALCFFPVPILTYAYLIWRCRGRGDNGAGRTLYTGCALFISSLMIFYAVWHWGYEAQVIEKIGPLAGSIRERVIPADFKTALGNMITEPSAGHYLRYMPVMWILSFLSIIAIARRASRKDASIWWAEIFAASWFLGSVAFFSFINKNARVLRWYFPAIVPMAVLAVAYLKRINSLGDERRERKVSPPGQVITFLLSSYFFISILRWGFNVDHFALWGIAAGMVGTLVINFGERWLSRHVGKRGVAKKAVSIVARGVVVVVVLGILTVQIQDCRYIFKKKHRKYSVRSLSWELGRLLPSGTVLAGLWAPVICLENGLKCYVSFDDPPLNNEADFLANYGISHVFAARHNAEERYYVSNFPREMGSAFKLAIYPFWRTEVDLFSFSTGQ